MAVLANVRGDVTSVDGTSFTTGAFNGIRNVLLGVFVVASDCVVPRPVVSQSLAGLSAISFDYVTSVTFGPSIHTLYFFIANSFMPITTSRTVSVDTSPTTATGFVLNVISISGLSKAGQAAIRQVARNPDGVGGAATTATFPVPLLTTNVYVAGMGDLTNPNNTAGPFQSGNTITLSNTGYATPTIGFSDYGKMNGDTSTTLTWNTPSATAWGTIAVEFDCSPYTSADTPLFEAGIGV